MHALLQACSYVPYFFVGLYALRTWLPFNRETNTKMTSLLTSASLAIWSQVGSIVHAQRALLGYIVSDSILKITLDGSIGFDVGLHHVLTTALVYSTQNRPESYHLIQKLMIMEFTTPFLYCSIILRNLKIQKSIMYASFACALLLWPYCRLYIPATVALEAIRYDALGASATVGLFGLQVYWYGLLWSNAFKLIKKNR